MALLDCVYTRPTLYVFSFSSCGVAVINRTPTWGGGKIVEWCGQTNEKLTVKDTIHETMGLWYVRIASDRAHANDGVMSGMGISK
jgi:hypothetical protein